MEVSARLVRRVEADFPPEEAAQVLSELRALPRSMVGGLDPERVLAAIVLPARGDRSAFLAYLELARTDWRDALMVGGTANRDWPERLDELLGPG